MTQTPESIHDELLVLRVQAGERDAFEELVRRWQRPLRHHARRLTGNDEDAWDVSQEAWVAIAKSIRRLDDPRRFAAWALRITSNKAADRIRKKQRDRKARPKVASTHVTEDPGPAGVDRADYLHRILHALPPERRLLLVLHYLNRLPIAAIAQVLELPEGTVKSRLHHTRKALTILLKGQEP